MGKTNISDKSMKVSKKVFLLWLMSLVLYALIFVSSEVTDGCIVLSAILVTAMMIAAMYGAVMIDMEIDHGKVLRAIQIFIGMIFAIGTIIVFIYNGIISELTTLDGLLTVMVIFGCVEFIVVVGSNALIAAAWCMADIHSI